MRLFFTTDIHGSERCFMKFVNAAKAYRADAIILGGDMTGKLLVPVVQEPAGTHTADVFGQVRVARTDDELAELEKTIRQAGSYTMRMTRPEKDGLDQSPEQVPAFFHRAILETVARWTAVAQERLAPLGVPIYMSSGNDDEFYVDDILASAEYVQCPEGRVLELPGGHEMISCGYSNITPFDSPRELPEDELEARLEAMASQLQHPDRAVFNLHCPPYNTSLDSAPQLDEQLRPVVKGGAMIMSPSGSLATRRVIERHQPMLAVHGHIHESRGAQKLGRTLCLNPGSEYSEGLLRGALIELNKNKVKGWQFTVG